MITNGKCRIVEDVHLYRNLTNYSFNGQNLKQKYIFNQLYGSPVPLKNLKCIDVCLSHIYSVFPLAGLGPIDGAGRDSCVGCSYPHSSAYLKKPFANNKIIF